MSCLGDVADVQYHGAASRWQVRLESGEVFERAARGDTRPQRRLAVGARVRLDLAARRCRAAGGYGPP